MLTLALIAAGVGLIIAAYWISNDVRPSREGVGALMLVLGLVCFVAAPVAFGLWLVG